MEVATVISIVPMDIRERKPMLPAFFELAKGSPETPSILIVENGINDIYVGEGRGHFGPDRSVIRVPIQADILAESVVNDYVDAQYGVIRPNALPGLFWMPGRLVMAQVMASPQLKEATEKQASWYRNLVKLADDDWQKYRQHKTISDIQRFAAQSLKLTRGWLIEDEVELALSECPGCFEKVNPKAIICAHCRFVLDKERYKAMQFAPAV